MSAKKIEGYASPNNAPDVILWHTPQNYTSGKLATVPATLVIHSGKSEPVYTHSEVVAMLNDILGHAVLLGGIGKERDHVHEEDIKEVAAAHGFTL